MEGNWYLQAEWKFRIWGDSEGTGLERGKRLGGYLPLREL